MNKQACQFGEELMQVGYFQYYGTLGADNIRPWDWEKVSSYIDGNLKPVWDLFLCRKRVHMNMVLTGLSSNSVEWLKSIGVLAEGGDELSTGGRYLIPQGAGFLFFDGTENSLLASEAAAHAAAPNAFGNGAHLSLFSQFAIENVIAKRQGYKTFLMAHQNMPEQLIRSTLQLNGLDPAEHLLVSVNGGKYDWISSTPPCLPHPDDVALSVRFSGGNDGLDQVLKSISVMSRNLTQGGVGIISFVIFSSEGGRERVEKIKDAVTQCGLRGDALVMSEHRVGPGSPFFSFYAGVLLREGGESSGWQNKMAEHFKESDISRGYFCVLRVSRGNGFVLTNISSQYYGTYFI